MEQWNMHKRANGSCTCSPPKMLIAWLKSFVHLNLQEYWQVKRLVAPKRKFNISLTNWLLRWQCYSASHFSNLWLLHVGRQSPQQTVTIELSNTLCKNKKALTQSEEWWKSRTHSSLFIHLQEHNPEKTKDILMLQCMCVCYTRCTAE